jgi:hypothetical protein
VEKELSHSKKPLQKQKKQEEDFCSSCGAVVTVRIASTRRSKTHGLKKPYKTLTNHSSASHNHALYYGRTEFYEERQVKDLHIFFIGLSYTDAIVTDNNEV